MTDEAVLRTAAMMAVMSMLEESSGTANVGRTPGKRGAATTGVKRWAARA